MINQRFPSLLVAFAALATLPSVARGSLRRLDGLGKWKDGQPTEIDCSLSKHDYEYYVERCIDEITQWWINGRCIDGVKEEVSELHRCMKPDGSRPYCHDCNDGRGNVKNVCGADSMDKEEVCGVAWSGSAEYCGEDGLTVYAHQCVAESGGSDHWYLREDYTCSAKEVYLSGPCMEGVPPRTEFTCGDAWYYPYTPNDSNLLKINPEWTDLEHPFATPSNKYCLDCGMAVQVCHGGDAEATCEDLGLPPKGTDSCELCYTEGAGAYVRPAPTDEGAGAAVTSDAEAEGAAEADPAPGEAAPASEPAADEPSPADGPVAAGPTGPAPRDADASVQSASAPAPSRRSWKSNVAGAILVVGGTSSVFV